MKKILNLVGIYGVSALLSGIFYREFVKYTEFAGETTLSVLHTHLFVMGVFFFLIILLFALQTELIGNKNFKKFYVVYNIGFPLMIMCLITRGVVQVLEISLSKGVSAALSGFAGISHIMMTVALVFLFLALKKVITLPKK